MSATAIDPFRWPFAVGVKVTFKLQPCPIGKEPLQSPSSAKSPVGATLATVSGEFPTFVKEIVAGPLVVPTLVGAKFSPAAENAVVGELGHSDNVGGKGLDVVVGLNCDRSTTPSLLKSPSMLA